MTRKYVASKRKQIIQHYKNGVTVVSEIRKLTGANSSYIYDVIRKYKEGKYKEKPETTQQPEQTGTEQPKTTFGTETPQDAKVEFVFDPITPPKELTQMEPDEKIKAEVDAAADASKKGTLTESMITHLFTSINDMIPQTYKRPPESMALLGNVWFEPLNRILGAYIDQNIDVYFAIIVTIVVFAPSAIDYTTEQRKKKETKLPESKQQKADSAGKPKVD